MPDGVRCLDPDDEAIVYKSPHNPVPTSWLLGITRLSAAAYLNLIPIAKRLLRAGFDPTAHDDMVWNLLGAGIPATGTGGPLELAARGRQPEVINLILATGMDPNLQRESIRAALILAVRNRDLRIASTLLAHGAVIEKRRCSGLSEPSTST